MATDVEIERITYAKGRDILGSSGGGQVKRLIRAKNGSHAQALAVLDRASLKHDPGAYVAAAIRGADPPNTLPYDPAL